MLKSMTAYGRGSLSAPLGRFVLEIQSVNRKFLEINAILPRELSQFDSELKKWLSPHIARGQVTIKVSVAFDGFSPLVVKPNLTLARQLKSAWEEISKELNVEEGFHLSLIRGSEGLLSFEENLEEEEAYRNILKQVFDQALGLFLQMKKQEGLHLQGDVLHRLKKIRQVMQLVELKGPLAPNKYREKLMARLEELLPGHIENEERILREVALFAEKIDITEEITRFGCHLAHAEELILSTAQTIGKTLEFVLQELNREINTIGNKSSDLEIARAVIEIKSELERIREQIQNVE